MSVEQIPGIMRALGLHGMGERFGIQLQDPRVRERAYEELLTDLLLAEQDARDNRRMLRLLRAAKLKEPQACLEDLDYMNRRGLEPSVIAALANCSWISRHQHLIVTGPTGTGKTYLACALAQQAIRKGMPVWYRRFPRLLEEIAVARVDGSLPKLRVKLAKVPLVVIDDWGVTPMSAQACQDFFEFVEDRTGSSSLVITAQLPLNKWHDYVGEPTLADAILDRLIHRSHTVALQGESMRKRMRPTKEELQ